MKRLYTIGVIMLFVLASCSTRRDYKIGVSQCSGQAWREQVNAEMRREAFQHDEIGVLNILTAYDSTELQIAQIQQLIDARYDIIIISPNESQRLAPVIERAYEAGIPVILFDRKADTDKYTTFIGGDNRAIGADVARYAASALGGHGKIIEIGGAASSTPAQERHQGFVEALSGDSITLLASEYTDWIDETARELADSLLTVYPDVDAFYCHTDFLASGVYKALIKHEREDQVKLFGIDGMLSDGGGLGMVARGELTASFTYPTGGIEIVQTALRILRHEACPKNVVLTSTHIDSGNAEALKLEALRIAALNDMIETREAKISTHERVATYQRVSLVAVAVVLIITVLFLIYYIRLLKAKNRLNRQLKEQRNDLIRMRRRLEDATRAKVRFFTGVSHDFRTPLTLIAGPVDDLVADASIVGAQKESLRMVQRNVRTLSSLIDQLLDFRKLEDNKYIVRPEVTELKDELQQWCDQVAPAMKNKHIRFAFSVDPALPPHVVCDPRIMQGIFLNLMSNAIKYTPAGGEIRLDVQREDASFVMRFFNSGSYIPPETAAKIFDEFYQAEGAQPGSGIGLALVRSFVQALDGQIRVESHAETGTTFVVSLPLAEPSAAQLASARQLSAQANAAPELDPVAVGDDEIYDDVPTDGEKSVVLVIDDNADVRQYVRQSLSPTYAVIEAANGKEGLQKAVKYVPDVIVCDVMMPVMDGIECCRRLKGESTTSHVPVVLLTARTLDEQRIEGYKCGADSYLTKPFSRDLLLARIDNLIANRRLLNVAFQQDKVVIEDPSVSEVEKTFVTQLYEVIRARISDPDLNVDELAREMNFSRVQLYRKIKSLTGQNPGDLLREERLRKARHLIQHTDKKIVEICQACGFSYATHFTKLYKLRFGIAPSEEPRPQT